MDSRQNKYLSRCKTGFCESSTSLHDKSPEKTRTEETYLSIIKALSWPYSQHTEWGKLGIFPLKSRLSQGCTLSPVIQSEIIVSRSSRVEEDGIVSIMHDESTLERQHIE